MPMWFFTITMMLCTAVLQPDGSTQVTSGPVRVDVEFTSKADCDKNQARLWLQNVSFAWSKTACQQRPM